MSNLSSSVVTLNIQGEPVAGRIVLRTVHRLRITITHPYRWLTSEAVVPFYAAKGVGFLGPQGETYARAHLAELLRMGRYLEQALPAVADALRADEAQLSRFALLLGRVVPPDATLSEDALHQQARELEAFAYGLLPPMNWQAPYVNARTAHQANVLLWHWLNAGPVELRA